LLAEVKSEENWPRAHLWANIAVFHWACFVALMEEHSEMECGGQQ